MKSIDTDSAEGELMSIRASSYVTVRKESSRVPVNGESGVGEA